MIRPYSIEWGLSIYFYLLHPNPTNNMNMKSHTNNMEVKEMKTKDDFLEGAKVTDDAHTYGPSNGGSAEHHSPQSVPNTEAAKAGKKRK